MARRLKAHRTGKGGAKYTKSHGGPAVRLAYAERCADKSAALKREAAIKKLPKAEKEALAAKWAADNCITIRMATPADGAAVAELYGKPQSREYAERFAEIVEHRDGHNTDRLLKELADKGVLNK